MLGTQDCERVSYVYELGDRERSDVLQPRRWRFRCEGRLLRRSLSTLPSCPDSGGSSRSSSLGLSFCTNHVHCFHRKELQIGLLWQCKSTQHTEAGRQQHRADTTNLHGDLTKNSKVKIMVLKSGRRKELKSLNQPFQLHRWQQWLDLPCQLPQILDWSLLAVDFPLFDRFKFPENLRLRPRSPCKACILGHLLQVCYRCAGRSSRTTSGRTARKRWACDIVLLEP
mmetsp:Transcript_42220/g.90690  ORF Transcript_42220/g.90690 Transcript_42220/m.90690 type:complete len:226 (+) Transcript_42220:950-1627(+)